MWAIELYAINLLISGWNAQLNELKKAPNIPIYMVIYKVIQNIIITRTIPYPPNFNKIAAKIIDPAVGASTCAFGNQKCIKKKGSLTKNGKMKINFIRGLIFSKNLRKLKLSVENSNKIIKKKGKEQKKL